MCTLLKTYVRRATAWAELGSYVEAEEDLKVSTTNLCRVLFARAPVTDSRGRTVAEG